MAPRTKVEKRMDADEGVKYTEAEFIEYYGAKKGAGKWKAAASGSAPAATAAKACTVCGKTNHTKADCKLKDKECSNCGKVGHIAKVCRQEGGGGKAAAAPAAQAGKACTVCGKDNHTKADCKLKDKECSNCGKVGHIAKVCRQEGGGGKAAAGEGAAGKACSCCGKTNHLKADCTLKDKECSNCGKVGHIAKVCRSGGAAPAKGAPKAKAKAKAKAKEFDYSGLEKGMKVQAFSEGAYHQAEVVTVSLKKKDTPVKVHWVGYTAASDEWVGGDQLRSKALKLKAHEGKEGGGFRMPQAAKKFLLVKPKMTPPLDKGFRPLVLGKRKYLEETKECTEKLEWALIRADGVGRYSLPVFDEKSRDLPASIYLAGVLIQEMIWQRSGHSLQLCGPARVTKALQKAFAKGGQYEYEVMSMPNVCGTPEVPFEVSIVEAADLAAAKDTPQVCGKDASGCRLAFDLGKSDIKTVAVKDGEVVYSKETEWDVTNVDPDYHFKAIVDALMLAKATLPRVDAVGGSATGTVSGANEATWCDIFPNVPADVYKAKVVDIFIRMAKEVAGDVPLKVINDGEVTALAAVQKLGGKGKILGISMGSSEGGGYANEDGNLNGWINEMCYIRLDLNPRAPTDPWTKGCHTGISHMYLGQRGATKLAAKGGVEVPDNMKYPHKDMCTITHENHAHVLKLIQKDMADPEKEPKCREIYETVGVYLGYGLGQYCEFYKIDHVMILGRVSKGKGGDLMLETAKKVLEEEFPDDCKHIEFHTADDHFKAVGQCIAAAALPTITKK